MDDGEEAAYACVNCKIVLGENDFEEHTCQQEDIEFNAQLNLDPSQDVITIFEVPAPSTSLKKIPDRPLKKKRFEPDGVRWTHDETIQLFEAYKKHIRKLVLATSNHDKRAVWEEVAAEVKMSKKRICDPYIARMKIDNLKKTWKKHTQGFGRQHWIYQEQMAIIKAEEDRANRELIEVGVERMLEKIHSEERADRPQSEEERSDSMRTRDQIPPWLFHHEKVAEVRHRKKMKVLKKFIDLLGTVVDSGDCFELS